MSSTRRSVNFVSLKEHWEHKLECKIPCSSLFFLLLLVTYYFLYYGTSIDHVTSTIINLTFDYRFFSLEALLPGSLKQDNTTEIKIIVHPLYTGRYRLGKIKVFEVGCRKCLWEFIRCF